MPVSNFPNGFAAGLTVRNMPLLQTHPGRVFWVGNSGGTTPGGQSAASNGNNGDVNKPFSTIAYAITRAASGDIIIVRPGHTESVSSATGMAMSTAGVAVVGLGIGSNRPTITIDTANTATIAVSADNCSFQNILFKANFLSIAACFVLTTAKNFTVENCEFRDTSSTLNFLNIVKSTGAANTVDGLTFNGNVVINLGVTTNNTTILTANTIEGLTLIGNYLKWAVQNDKAIGVIVTAGILTNLRAIDNIGYRPNTTTAGGSFINVGGTTSTGVVARNLIQTLTTTTDLLFTTSVGLAAFENRVSGVVGATGFVIPAVDS